jgi:hypothetical protein
MMDRSDCGSTSPRSVDELIQFRMHAIHYLPAVVEQIRRTHIPGPSTFLEMGSAGYRQSIAGRPAHDHWTNSSSSGCTQPTIWPPLLTKFVARRFQDRALFLETESAGWPTGRPRAKAGGGLAGRGQCAATN